MAEQIFPSPMAAMLRGSQIPSVSMGPPPEVMLGAPSITLAQLLRSSALQASAMVPATMTGRENSPQQPPMALPASVDVAPIDYGARMPGTRPLAEALPGAFPEAERGYYRETERPTSGIAAGPQSAREAFDLRRQGQDLAFVGGQALPMAVGGPASRGIDAAVSGAGALGRAALASPPGQWVVRNVAEPVAGTISRNPTMAGFLAAGGVTAATPGQTADAPPLRERAPGARKAEADVRGRLATAEEDLRKAREDVARYDDRSFNWRDPDAVEAAQRNFQGMDIRVRDPKTGQMVPVPSDRRDGPLTRQGAAEYARRAAARVKDLEAGLAATRTELERAGTAVREAEGLDARDISARRMKELDEPTLVQRFGPNAGYFAGLGQGAVERWMLGRAFRGLERARTDRANTLMADLGKGDANERVGRLNQIWTEGGSRNPPYAYTPGTRPYPWTAAPDAPPPGVSSVFSPRDPSATLNASRLYRPGPLESYGPVAGTTLTGGYEWLQGEHNMEEARRELIAAETAVAGKPAPTEVEMQRIRDARQGLAWATFLRNVGRGGIAGGAMTDLHMRAHAPSRPNIGRAETERGAVDLLLNPPPALPPPPPSPAVALPHSSSFQPRAGGRFAGPPDFPRGDPRRRGP
jgi:hypothetical protein